MNRFFSSVISALALASSIAAQATQPPQPFVRATVELPAGPTARAFAGVGPDTAAARLTRGPVGGLETPEWRAAEPWKNWAEIVRAESLGAQPDPKQRALLAQIALAQARWDDAWDHFAATGADPAVCAALLPRFLPGVPVGNPAHGGESNPTSGFPVGAGGIVAVLPDGVLLRPAPPPPSVPAAQVALGRAFIERREMRIDGLQIGAATLAMKVGLESDGIQIDFDHRGGGAVHLRVLLPDLADFEVRVAYVDWMRQDEAGGVLEVDVSPGDETHTLFGRFRPRTISWPTNLPGNFPRFVAENGLNLEFPPSAPDAAVFQAAGPAFARVLGIPVSGNGFASKPFGGVRIDLADTSVARRKFLGLVTLSERFALRK